MSEQQNKNLAEVGRWEEDRWVWTLHWNGRIEGVMAIQLTVMMNILSSVSLVRGKKDSWFWTKESDGKYSVRSAYDGIFESNVDLEEDCFKLLWKLKIPSNALALCWKVLLNRIPTRDNLIRRQIQLADSCCPLCGDHDETVAHLFFFCNIVGQIWFQVLKWLGISFVSPAGPKEHFTQFAGLLSFNQRTGLMAVWISLIWNIWVGRNEVIFKGGNFNSMEVFEKGRMRAWEWLRAKNTNFIHAMVEWYNEPLACLADMSPG